MEVGHYEVSARVGEAVQWDGDCRVGGWSVGAWVGPHTPSVPTT